MDIFIKKNIGFYIAAIGIVLGILNLIFLQGLNSLNSYFLFLEGILVVGMSMFAFFRWLIKEDAPNLYRHPHFWFITILVLFWSATFLNWGLYDYINLHFKHAAWKVNTALTILSIISYTSFGIVYILYPKMKQVNE